MTRNVRDEACGMITRPRVQVLEHAGIELVDAEDLRTLRLIAQRTSRLNFEHSVMRKVVVITDEWDTTEEWAVEADDWGTVRFFRGTFADALALSIKRDEEQAR